MDGVTLLRRAREAGLNVEAEGDKLVIRGPRRAEPIVRLLIEHKPEVMAALTPGTMDHLTVADVQTVESTASASNPRSWHNLFAKLSVHHELDGQRPRAEAVRLAYGECIARWHQLFGRRRPGWQCAGCDAAIGGLAALTLADGNRVHFDNLNCLLSFGQSWRSEAVAGLQTLGLDPPIGFEAL